LPNLLIHGWSSIVEIIVVEWGDFAAAICWLRCIAAVQLRVLLVKLALDQVDLLLRRLGLLADKPVGAGLRIVGNAIILFYG
jgi:hypothetical protein